MSFSFIKRHSFWIILIALIVLLGAFGASRNAKKSSTKPSGNIIPRVALVSASGFQKNRAFVTSNGIVESLEQADLRSQVSAPVQRVSAVIGAKVRRGQVLVTLQNSDVAAQVAQASAAVNAAQARLDEMVRGARTEDVKIAEARVSDAEESLENTKRQQDTAVANAQSAMLNAGLAATIYQGNTSSATATVSGTYNSTQEGQYNIEIILTGGGLVVEYRGLENGSAGFIRNAPIAIGNRGLFITFGAGTLNGGEKWVIEVPNKQSASYLTYANAYQSSLAARQTAISAAENAVVSAKNQLNLLLAGTSNEQIRAQQAALQQARANLAAASAQLDKTVIRSPIDGVVSVVNVKFGDLVTPGQAIVSVVNKSGMQIKSFISSDDLGDIQEGAEVDINETIKGVVHRISPSINPSTKSVEVSIAVSDPANSGLTIGQSASAKIHTKNVDASGDVAYLIPFQAVKIGDGGKASVFVVDQESMVQEVSVTIGNIVGEHVEVKSGLNNDMKLINSVYDVVPGQKVVTE
jgi:RND family efflux transporter MFP subunit